MTSWQRQIRSSVGDGELGERARERRRSRTEASICSASGRIQVHFQGPRLKMELSWTAEPLKTCRFPPQPCVSCSFSISLFLCPILNKQSALCSEGFPSRFLKECCFPGSISPWRLGICGKSHPTDVNMVPRLYRGVQSITGSFSIKKMDSNKSAERMTGFLKEMLTIPQVINCKPWKKRSF